MTLETDPGSSEPVGSWVALTIDCCDTRTVAAFWGKMLGVVPRGYGRPGWYRIGPTPSGHPAVSFQPVPETKLGKARVHIDLRVDDLDAAVARVRHLGGSGPRAVHRYDEGSVAVMSDPEGNEFCLVALVAGASLA
jgi:predicted enzyme related to lactoylglutathione lyase